MTRLTKREFIAAAAGSLLGSNLTGYAFAGSQQPAEPTRATARSSRESDVPHRRATTTRLFKSPGGYPNALAGSPDGLWVGEQKLSAELAERYGIPEPEDLVERAWLVDWETGKVLRTVETQSRNTSGMAYGDGYIWMGANAPPHGIFQTDMDSRTISHRQVPLGGGGNHGVVFHESKLWIVSGRMRGMLRVDPYTWQPEFFIPYDPSKRHHEMAFDDEGYIWLITGNQQSRSYAEGEFGLAKYDATTGQLLETVEFEPGSADPHGLEFYNGALYSCDAGIHPGWPVGDSPHSGDIFRIDII